MKKIKTLNVDETRYVYDGDDIVADLDVSNNIEVLYLTPSLDENLFMKKWNGSAWVRYWYFHNGLGSMRQNLLRIGITAVPGQAHYRPSSSRRRSFRGRSPMR